MKILAVTGASGGHIYPALAFLEKARLRPGVSDLLFVLPDRGGQFENQTPGLKIIRIPSARLTFSSGAKSAAGILNFMTGAFRSLLIFLRFKPDIVVGFGSIDSIPLIMFAWFFRAKAVIHEQNVLPGRANRFLARFADKVAISFAESRRYLHLTADKIVLTGNPLRGSLRKIPKEEALRGLGLDNGKFTILVMGGSQGSSRINSIFISALGLMRDKQRLQVIHLSGKGEYEAVLRRYEGMGIKAKVFSFFKEMSLVYSAADLAISRAGATTISELMYFKLAAVIVPYPFAYSHQSLNAKILERNGVAIVMSEDTLGEDDLRRLLEGFIFKPEALEETALKYKGLPKSDSASLLVNAVIDLA